MAEPIPEYAWSYDVSFDDDSLIITPFNDKGVAIAFCKVSLDELASVLAPRLRGISHERQLRGMASGSA